MSKPETRFYTAIHKLLPKHIHREKMHNAFRGGTADAWYSGPADDLWVEYKWIAKLNKRALIRMDRLLSPLQMQWLHQRYKEGRNVVVILGTPEGAWIFERLLWEYPLDPNKIRQLRVSKQNVAEYIIKRTCLHAETATQSSKNNGDDVQGFSNVVLNHGVSECRDEKMPTPKEEIGTGK